jgi:hypothetical protein
MYTLHHAHMQFSGILSFHSQHIFLTFNDSVRFEVFTVTSMKNAVSWDVLPCGSCKEPTFWWSIFCSMRGQRNGSSLPLISVFQNGARTFYSSSPSMMIMRLRDHVPGALLLRKSGSAKDRTRDLWICSQLSQLEHRAYQRALNGFIIH